MRAVATDGPWAGKLARASESRAPRHQPDWYFRLLHGGVAELDIWRTVYYHRLADGAAGIVEWFKGSGLRPFLGPLTAAEREAYLARYREALDQAYTPLEDGSALLPFPRIFIVARRSG